MMLSSVVVASGIVVSETVAVAVPWLLPSAASFLLSSTAVAAGFSLAVSASLFASTSISAAGLLWAMAALALAPVANV